jgi:hypothetical protein
MRKRLIRAKIASLDHADTVVEAIELRVSAQTLEYGTIEKSKLDGRESRMDIRFVAIMT